MITDMAQVWLTLLTANPFTAFAALVMVAVPVLVVIDFMRGAFK